MNLKVRFDSDTYQVTLNILDPSFLHKAILFLYLF